MGGGDEGSSGSAADAVASASKRRHLLALCSLHTRASQTLPDSEEREKKKAITGSETSDGEIVGPVSADSKVLCTQ